MFNIVFEKQPEIRKKVFELEEKLKGKFGNPSVLPMPDEFDENAPRIIMQSLGGHSTLVVTFVNAQLETRFDNDFINDWDKCSEYLIDRFSAIYDCFENIISSKVKFMGLIATVKYDVSEKEEAVKKLLEKLGSQTLTNSNPFDVNIRLTYVNEDKYYVNLGISNNREMALMKGSTNNEIIQQLKDNLLFVIDVNDRYASNSDFSYRTTKEIISAVANKVKSVIDVTIPTFIDSGEIKL
jgi:hypothetical protein